MKNYGTKLFPPQAQIPEKLCIFPTYHIWYFLLLLNACCTCVHNHKLMSSNIYFWETFMHGFEYDIYSCKWRHNLSKITKLYYSVSSISWFETNVVLVILGLLIMKFNNFQSFVCYGKYPCVADCPFFSYYIWNMCLCIWTFYILHQLIKSLRLNSSLPLFSLLLNPWSIPIGLGPLNCLGD